MKKRVDQFKPGDILVYGVDVHGKTRATPIRAVVASIIPAPEPGSYVVWQVTLNHGGAPLNLISFIRAGDVEFEVEVPELTPAQQHAEELLAAAREYLPLLVDNVRTRYGDSESISDPEIVALRALLAKLAPPAPPTLEEALDALMTMADGAAAVMAGTWDKDTMQAERNAALDIIARARATGVLK